MATVVTLDLRFLHVPKTGGSWVTAAMAAAGVLARRPRGVPFHADLAGACDYADRFTFAFVRHPLDLWRSYWAYRLRAGWDPDSDLDRDAASPDFDQFVNRMIERAPGPAGDSFERFVGPVGAEIDFIGRYERLVDDLVAALRIAGETFDETLLRAHPRVNSSDYAGGTGLYTRRTAERLAEHERATIERFYPADPIPQRPRGALGAAARWHARARKARPARGRAARRSRRAGRMAPRGDHRPGAHRPATGSRESRRGQARAPP